MKLVKGRTGFRTRCIALWIDLLILYVIVQAAFYLILISPLLLYFPFQFIYFSLSLVYMTVFGIFTNSTPGKLLLGLRVVNLEGGNPSLFRIITRESAGKSLSFMFFGLGFFMVAFGKRKAALHDYLTKTVVVTKREPKKWNFWKLAGGTSLLSFIVYYAFVLIWIFYPVDIRGGGAELFPSFVHRAANEVNTVEFVKDRSIYREWLKRNAIPADEYFVKITAKHQLTILGESHDSKENLEFINRNIVNLYKESGVRTIGLEVVSSCMNDELERLTTAELYDEDLAMKIARAQIWKMWGSKGYWDLLKSVWQLNHGLPRGAKKMRVVGVDIDLEMPNIVLLNIGGDAKGQTSFYENFRLFSALPDIIKAIKRDELMVRNVEEQILDKNEKGVVLIGYNHSTPFFGYPIIESGKISALKERFGLILFKKYGQRIFQIQLNNTLVPTKDYRKGVYYFIERSLEEDGLFPVGFDILNSPFATLRDEQCYFFKSWPSVSLQDVSEGLIALRPEKEGQVCTWTKEFFNKEMYMRYKPLYELMTRKKFNNLRELNSYFERRYR